MRKIIFILFFSLMMITTVAAVDSSSWSNVTIENHVFKIPPKYNGGKLNNNSYQIGNWNNFAILCVDNYLANNYGFEVDTYGPGEDLNIDGHPARYFHGYNKYEKCELSRIYFSVGKSIYCISWQSNNLTDDVKEIIASSDPSEISSNNFYNTLDSAYEDYIAEEEEDENAYIPSSTSSNTHNHHFFIRI